MVPYEEAYKKAAEQRKDINYCTEYEGGWLFGNTDDENWTGGAGHTPIIITKDTGKAVNAPTFFMQLKPGEIIREDIPIDEAGRMITAK